MAVLLVVAGEDHHPVWSLQLWCCARGPAAAPLHPRPGKLLDQRHPRVQEPGGKGAGGP